MHHWPDILLSVPLVWMAYKGFTRGFIMEVTRFVALVAGVYLAARFSELLSEYLYRNTSVTWDFLPIVSFAIILVGVIVLVHLFGKMLGKVVRMAAMGWADKASGALFGLSRAALLLSLLLMLLNRFGALESFDRSETASRSLLYRPVLSIAPFIMPILEDIDRDTLLDRISREADSAEEKLRGLIP